MPSIHESVSQSIPHEGWRGLIKTVQHHLTGNDQHSTRKYHTLSSKRSQPRLNRLARQTSAHATTLVSPPPPPPPPPLPSAVAVQSSSEQTELQRFLSENPEYTRTAQIDCLRSTSYARLDGLVYVDYMGGSLLPEELVHWHASYLQSHVMGNTHSHSRSSLLSSQHALEARHAVLSFFDAPKEDYTVVFTSSATAALKLVGESFPFTRGSSLVLPADAHNSVHGLRSFARHAGSLVQYIPSLPRGGLDLDIARNLLRLHQPTTETFPSLFAFTGQSNITNTKTPLSIAADALECNYYTLLDAAALAPTTSISLRTTPVDAMALSFYKMFGYPTGVGALVIRKSFLSLLSRTRPWFAGGSVDIVQVPGSLVTLAEELHERFEDGTINYLSLPAITRGLQFLSPLMPILPLRLACLTRWLIHSLSELRYQSGRKCVEILSRTHKTMQKRTGDELGIGSIISLVFLDENEEAIPLSFVEFCAFQRNISLRTGCMCNPGGAAAMLGIESYMDSLTQGTTLRDLECRVGRELGVVRISLGLASNFHDAHQVLKFGLFMADEERRGALMAQWLHSNAA